MKMKKNHADPDRAINIGLYNYPILMAADILLFGGTLIPIGKDQTQHIEITNDIRENFNAKTKSQCFAEVHAKIDEDMPLTIGIDGRKMSKSYGNTISLLDDAKKIRKKAMKIPTDSKSVEEPKDPDNCNVFFHIQTTRKRL